MESNLIWIDTNIDNKENSEYKQILTSINSIRLKTFKNIELAIKFMKEIEYQETKIIISGRLYAEFITKFKENITSMRIVPKIIVFTGDKNKFLEFNKDYEKDYNSFYSHFGIATSFKEIKQFLQNNYLNKSDKKPINSYDNTEFIFEYLDSIEKINFPLIFMSMIDNISLDDIDQYNNYLYNTFSKENDKIKNLLEQLKLIPNIPIEILAKFYVRFYTADSNFLKNINSDLRKNIKEKYLPFVKVLYQGVKLKSLPLSSKNILYRSLIISDFEINKIKNFLKNKIKDLPSHIICTKSFLSFTKDKNIALKFMVHHEIKKAFSVVLFILEKDDLSGYDLATHCETENESFYPLEKEVLFFPFSFFEIKDIKEIKHESGKAYEIKLLYLGKYMKEIQEELNGNEIPDSDFKKQLIEFGLIKK